MSTINRKFLSNSPKGDVELSSSLKKRSQKLRHDRMKNPLKLSIDSYLDHNVNNGIKALFMKASTTRKSPNRVLKVGTYLRELTTLLPPSFSQSSVKIGSNSANLHPSDRDARKSHEECELSQAFYSPGMYSWVAPWIGIRSHHFYNTKVSTALKSQENLEPVFGEDLIDRLAHKIRYHIRRLLPYSRDLGVGPHVSPYRSVREMTFYGRASGKNGAVLWSAASNVGSSKRIGVKVIPCSFAAVASKHSSFTSAHTCTGYAPAIVSYLAMSDLRSGPPVDPSLTSSATQEPYQISLDGGYYVDISKRWRNNGHNGLKAISEEDDMTRLGPCRRSFEPLVSAKDTLIVHQSFGQMCPAAILGLTAPSVRFLLETLATSGLFIPALDVPLIIAACENWYSYGCVQQLQTLRCVIILAHTRISFDGACLPGSDHFRTKVGLFLLDTAPFFTKKMWQSMPKLLNFYGKRGCLLEVLEVIDISLLWAGDSIPTDFIRSENGDIVECTSSLPSSKISSGFNRNHASIATYPGDNVVASPPSQSSAGGAFFDFEKDYENNSSILNVNKESQRQICHINYFPNGVSSTCAATAAFMYFSQTCGIGLFLPSESLNLNSRTWWSVVKDVANILAADGEATSGASDIDVLGKSIRRDDRPLLKGCVMLVRCVGEVYSVVMSKPSGLPIERLTAVTAWAAEVFEIVCLIVRGALGAAWCKCRNDANFDPVGLISPRNGGDLIADIFSELGLVLECVALVIRSIVMKQQENPNSYKTLSTAQLSTSSAKETDKKIVLMPKDITPSSPFNYNSSPSLFRNKKKFSVSLDIPSQFDALMDVTLNILIPPLSIIAATGINSLHFDEPLVQPSTRENCRDAAVQCLTLHEVIFKVSNGLRSFFCLTSPSTNCDRKAAELLKQKCEEVIESLSCS